MNRPDSTSSAPTASPPTRVCPGCTLLCDDIRADTGDWHNACPTGQAWFESMASLDATVVYRIGRKEVTRDEAVGAAQKILNQARSPLICGLDRIGWQAQAAAVRLAIQRRATIDVDCGPADRSAAHVLTREGWVTATMGEIRDRAQGAIFWFVDPDTTHPRLWERCRLDDKSIVMIGPGCTTTRPNPQWIELTQRQAADTLAVWEMLVQGRPLDDNLVIKQTGFSVAWWSELLNSISRWTHAAWFVSERENELMLGRLCRLIRQWNRTQRTWLIHLRRDRNGQSAENVLAALTGFSHAVSLRTGIPQFNGGEFSAYRQLATGAVDAGLFFGGADPSWTESVQTTWRSIPKIVFVDSSTEQARTEKEWGDSTVSITLPGIGHGDWARWDDVLLPVQTPTADTVASFLESLNCPDY